MIARHEATAERIDLWARLAAPVPEGAIAWRQDGRAVARDGKFFARFVAYIEANTVRERLDTVVPGEWDLTLELMPTLVSDDADEPTCSFKARLQVLGVIREEDANRWEGTLIESEDGVFPIGSKTVPTRLPAGFASIFDRSAR